MTATTKTEIRELRTAITKLTGKTPTSEDPRYLRDRLAELKARKDAGEDVKHKTITHSVFSISMPVEMRQAIDRIVEREKIGASELARRALALWAEENGYKTEAKTFTT
jgi:hypothetical protein